MKRKYVLLSDEKTSPEREVVVGSCRSGLLWDHSFQNGFNSDGVTTAPPRFVEIAIALQNSIRKKNFMGIVIPCNGHMQGLKLDPLGFFCNIPLGFFQLSDQTCIHPSLLSNKNAKGTQIPSVPLDEPGNFHQVSHSDQYPYMYGIAIGSECQSKIIKALLDCCWRIKADSDQNGFANQLSLCKVFSRIKASSRSS
jgi:hypothetical protein